MNSDDLPNFECSACGECCKDIWRVPELMHLYDETKKSCKYLVNRKCIIYEDRPDVCNYKKLYELVKHQYTPNEFYQTAVTLCNKIKNNSGQKHK